MAQTNLRLTQKDIRDEAAAEAKWAVDYSTWSSEQQALMTRIVKRAMRMAFQPPILPGEFTPHLWSWLKPISSIDLWGTQSPTSGVTVSAATASATVTISGTSAFYESMVGKTITFYSNDDLDTVIGTGVILAVGASTLTLTAAAGIGGAGTTYRWGIVSDGTFRLPVEFVGMEGRLFHATGEGKEAIEKGNEATILDYLQKRDSEGQPRSFAVRPVAGYTGAAEQPWELLIGPLPDAHYTMKFRMHLNVDALILYDGSDKYLPGGSVFTELFRGAALAATESEIYRQRGLRYQEFITDCLTPAVHFDRAHNFPENLGENRADGSRGSGRTSSWYDDVNGPDVFVNGDQMFQ